MAETDIEWFWRLGFRRVLPGRSGEAVRPPRTLLAPAAIPRAASYAPTLHPQVRGALKPMSSADSLLSDYLHRWPKEEEPLALPPDLTPTGRT